MSKANTLENITDPAFVPSLNESISDLYRRSERQARKFQRIEGVKVALTTTAVPHLLGKIPESVAIEIIEFPGFVFPDVWFSKRHTKTTIYVRASAVTTIDLVLRG